MLKILKSLLLLRSARHMRPISMAAPFIGRAIPKRGNFLLLALGLAAAEWFMNRSRTKSASPSRDKGPIIDI